MKRKSALLLLGVLLIVLVACTPASPTATPTEQAATPAPTVGPTATAEPTGRGPLVIEDGKLYLAIIWHQHQPVYYQDPNTGIYQKPWVRLHAAKDYVDMATMLEDYPDIHVTFNITPSLIRQLDDISNGARDLYWVMTEVPANELTDDQKQFLLDRFFDTNRNIIARFPRYQELLGMQADGINAWSEQDFRDLQVLFNLAWTDPGWLAQEPLASLVAKGRDYTEEDKTTVLDEHLRLVQEVIPIHKQLQDAGQIEVTMTPFAHPILPLLVDSNLAAVAMPDANLPTRFVYGQDATAQVELGVQFYEDHFGQAPRGMWPAEGSVAQQVVSMISNAGIQWIATDELVLANSLPDFPGFTRDNNETVIQADQLYQPYDVQGTRGGPVAIIFRDHTISDKVGFTYSGMAGDQAAADFMQRLENIKAELEADGSTGPHLVTVLLDGENAWENYPNDGKDFLNALYTDLSESQDIVTVTPSEYLDALAANGTTLNKIDNLYPGSWIDGTFSTWIGEDEENQAWEYLKTTRDALQEAITAGTMDDATLQQVMQLMYIAEGSDWFWWYGADQNSGNDSDFDQQFRSYLAQIYTLIGQPVPDFVYVPIIPQSAQNPDKLPGDVMTPTIDGTAGAGEWDNAGNYVLDGQLFSGLYYGFDANAFYLRLDSTSGFPDNRVVGFYIGTPGSGSTNAYSRNGEGTNLIGFGVKKLIEVKFEGGVPTAVVYEANGAGGWRSVGTLDEVAASDTTLEIRAPFADFAPEVGSGNNLNVRMVVSDDGVDVATVPANGPALATVPDLPIPNVFADWTDPSGDDNGPGTYTYPTDAVFKTGTFDILGVTIGQDDENYIFRVQFRGTVSNDWGAPNGMGTQTVDIYIDTDGAANGDRLLLPGRNAAFTADFGWDYAIWAEGWTPGIFVPGPDGPVEMQGDTYTIITNPGQQRLSIIVPKRLLPDTDPTTWHFAVAVLSQEGYPSAGVWRVRDVTPGGEQWRIGGGTGSNLDTRIKDFLLPEGSDVTQSDALANPSPGETVDLSTLTPDDYPQVIMLSP